MYNTGFVWLQHWYLSQCDGHWEHEFGIKLETLDNPGWKLVIDLSGTEAEGRSFERYQIERSEHDWLYCWVTENQFQAVCGPLNLAEAMDSFRTWIGPVPSVGLPETAEFFDWAGASGKTYRYWFSDGPEWTRNEPGNYMVVKRTAQGWSPMHIGQAENLRLYVPWHDQSEWPNRHGATRIMVHLTPEGLQTRLDEQRDLVERWALSGSDQSQR